MANTAARKTSSGKPGARSGKPKSSGPFPTIEELCQIHGNEDAHTHHVTALALCLFEKTHKKLGIAASERTLLEAACRLHDIGYAGSPRNHAGASARIIRARGVYGFSAQRVDYIAAIILLHPFNRNKESVRRALRGLGRPERARRLACFLRVADGLDHGHMQDTTIGAVRWRGNAPRVEVVCGWYEGNVSSGQRKADLWQEAFGTGIELVAVPPKRRRTPFGGLVHKRDRSVDAARRLLYSQYRTAVDNEEGAAAGTGEKPLHDIRVAIRRMRAVLRMFKPTLRGTEAKALDKALQEQGRRLGPARDHDVWVGYLAKNMRKVSNGKRADWEQYLEDRRRLHTRQVASVRQVLGSQGYRDVFGDVKDFARIEMSSLARQGAGEDPYSAFAARKVRGQLKKLVKKGPPPANATPEEMHRMRKRCRRLRYYAEFAAPVLGETGPALLGRLKAITSSLGQLHDMDVFLARLDREPGPPPRGLRSLMRKRRKTSRAGFDDAWEELTSKKFLSRVQQRLSTQAKKKPRSKPVTAS